MTLPTIALMLVLCQDPLSDPRLDAPVTLRQDAAPLTSVVKNLGSAGKVALTASAGLGSQIVIVDVSSTSLREVMAKLADVTDCDWSASEGGYVLSVSTAKRQRSESADRQRRADMFRPWLQEFGSLATSDYTPEGVANTLQDKRRRWARDDSVTNDDSWAENFRPRLQGSFGLPYSRAFARAISTLTPETLADIGAESRVVYSTSPNKMQRRLALDPAKETAALSQDAAVLEKAKGIVGLKGDDRLGQYMQQAVTPAQPVAKALLVVTRTEQLMSLDMMSLAYTMFDEGGDEIASEKIDVPLDVERFSLFTSGSDFTAAPKIETKPDSVWHWNALTASVGGKAPSADDPRFASILRRPDVSEPLSFLTSDILVASTRQEKKNLIAELSDFEIIVPMLDGAMGSDLTGFRSRLYSSSLEDVSKDPAWRLLRPRSLPKDRSNRVDRSSLAAFLKGDARSNLVLAATYAAHRGSPSSFNLVELTTMWALNKGQGEDDLDSVGQYSDPMLQWVGSLDPAVRTAFLKGAAIAYSRCRDDQKKLLQRVAFGPTSSENLDFPEQGSPSGDLDVKSLMREPTELLPNGLPADAYVVVNPTDEPQVYALSADGKAWAPLSTYELARALVVQKRPNLRREGDRQAPPTRFRVGVHRTYDLRLQVSRLCSFASSFTENLPPAPGSECDYQRLPEQFRREVEEAFKSLLNAPDGGGGVQEEGATTGGGGGSL